MQKYIGIKRLSAKPMTRGAYNALRGWNPPDGEDQSVDGYLVEYRDGGGPNVSGFAGYVSWSQKCVFENSYQPITDAEFECADQPFKLRVVQEKHDLDGRLQRLKAFFLTEMFRGLPEDEQHRMVRQSGLMENLSAVLGERIAAFSA